jgi:hypothetical protein
MVCAIAVASTVTVTSKFSQLQSPMLLLLLPVVECTAASTAATAFAAVH